MLTVTPEALVQASPGAEVMEIVRGQETELPQALKWQVGRSDDAFDAVVVEARRITVDSARVSSESFPIVVPPEETDRRCRRALMEAWAGRETATLVLPPSRLALDPTDVIRLEHDGRGYDLRITRVADAEARSVEAIRQDREVYDMPPGTARKVRLRSPVLFPAPEVVFLDLPRLDAAQALHRPLLAAYTNPWPGRMAIWRSDGGEDWQRVATLSRPGRIGALAFDLHSGPLDRLDLGNAMIVDLLSGTLTSVSDSRLFAGGNGFAVETTAGQWEIVQAGSAELQAPGRYRLTRLLRGQRGTEAAMAPVVAAGARVVVLDAALAELPVDEAELGRSFTWRVGPARRPVADSAYTEASFTPHGLGLRPFSVVHVSQPWRRGRVPGDLTIAWVRRSRALAADNWEGGVPLAEERQEYEVEVLDGATVVRSFTAVDATSIVYTAAQQTADWGAPLGPGDTLDVRIAQISAVVGRGPRRSRPCTSEGTAMPTAHLQLPFIAASQAQKHVTHNEALRLLDGLVQLAVLDRDRGTPPGAPVDGDRYLVAAGATGAWAGWDGSVAYWVDGAWMRLAPRRGWIAWVEDESRALVWTGSSWTPLVDALGLIALGSSVVLAEGPAGARTSVAIAEELLSLSGANVDSTVVIPNRAIVLGVSTRTVTAVTGAASYDCGIVGEPAKFGGSLGVGAGSTNAGVIGPQAFYARTPIRLTANGGSFAGGAVRIAIHYLLPRVPQS